MKNISLTELLALASKGASLSIDGAVYSLTAIQALSQAIKRMDGHLTIRNADSKSHTALLSIADKHITFEL